MKTLFHKDLCPRPFGSAVFNVPALLEWATKKGLSLPTVPPLTDYDFAQAECVLSLIANRPHDSFTPDEAHAIAAANPLLAHHPAAQSAAPTAVWLVGAEASRQWREILSKAIAGRELVLLDPNSLLPVETAGAPAGNVDAVASPSGDDMEEQAPAAADHNETLAALFDPVPVEALAKMFQTDKEESTAQWKIWTEKAKANGLIGARVHRKFNPYKAGNWFVNNGAEGWDTARLYRTLARNLPARSLGDAHLLTDGID